MPQLHLYVPDEMAKELRERAHSNGLSLSRYLAKVVRHELGQGWPEGFFDRVAGGWQGSPLKRAPQGKLEEREAI